MPLPRPIWIWIDPSQACNLSCAFCYSKQSHSSVYLRRDDLSAYLDKILGCQDIVVQKLHLNWRGEPTMNPELSGLIAELESRCLTFPYELHTNGTLINPTLAQKLCSEVKRGTIYVSVDGGTEQAHDLNRGPGTFRKAIAGASLLLKSRGASKKPTLGIFQLDLGQSERDYDTEFVDVIGQVDNWVRVPPAHPKTLRRMSSLLQKGTLAQQQANNQSQKSIARKPEARWWTHGTSSQPEKPCFWLGNALFIAPNGDVSVCLISRTAEGIIGNLKSDSMQTIVTAASAFRAQVTCHSRSQTSHCAGCMMEEGEARQEIFS